MISKARQLASITAVGASAIALGGKAEAASIVVSSILDTTIGFTNNLPDGCCRQEIASHIFTTFASGPAFKFLASSLENPGNHTYMRQLQMGRLGSHSTTFGAKSGGADHVFAAGAAWASVTQSNFAFQVGQRTFGAVAHTNGLPAFTDQYFLFEFSGTSFNEYGWIEATMSVANSTSNLASDGPNITIIQYAFDNSGAVITAGEGTTPEPSSIAESGLAALILGAEGLRRWRKARKAS
jgi:hypothetical protein